MRLNAALHSLPPAPASRPPAAPKGVYLNVLRNRWGDGGSGRLSHLLRVIRSGGGRVRTRCPWGALFVMGVGHLCAGGESGLPCSGQEPDLLPALSLLPLVHSPVCHLGSQQAQRPRPSGHWKRVVHSLRRDSPALQRLTSSPWPTSAFQGGQSRAPARKLWLAGPGLGVLSPGPSQRWPLTLPRGLEDPLHSQPPASCWTLHPTTSPGFCDSSSHTAGKRQGQDLNPGLANSRPLAPYLLGLRTRSSSSRKLVEPARPESAF